MAREKDHYGELYKVEGTRKVASFFLWPFPLFNIAAELSASVRKKGVVRLLEYGEEGERRRALEWELAGG